MSDQLEQWVERLSSSGLPVFAKTVREVAHVTGDRGSSARDLSTVVSHDAAMTARLIQIANSSLFNPQGRKVDTISAAVVLMGFDAVRDLAISLSVIDEMIRGGAHTRVQQVMARAFHAAVQANSLARKSDTRSSEEVFVAALLKDVGEMAFWSKGGDATRALNRALETDEEPETAQRRELGFTLDALSRRLTEKWNLGDLARHSHDPRRQQDAPVACIARGHALAEAYQDHGWCSPQSQALIAQIAKDLGMDEAQLRAAIEQNIEEAAAIAQNFGIAIEATLVCEPEDSPAAEVEAASGHAAGDAQAREQQLQNQLQKQLQKQMDYLSRLAAGIEDGLERDQLMRMLVNAVQDCLTAEACCFMLLSPDREQLVVKYAAGTAQPGLATRVAESERLGAALASKKPISATIQPDGNEAIDAHELLCGVHIGGREVGVLQVQRAQTFDDAALAVFRQFAQQVVLVLTQAS